MSKKYFLLFIAPIAVLFAIYVGLAKASNFSAPQKQTAEKTASKVTVVLNYGSAVIQSFTTQTTSDSTAYSVLKDVTDKQDIPLVSKKYDFGIFVQSIGGKESTAKMSWIYFVNGTSGDKAADQYLLKPGDSVEWKYTIPSGE